MPNLIDSVIVTTFIPQPPVSLPVQPPSAAPTSVLVATVCTDEIRVVDPPDSPYDPSIPLNLTRGLEPGLNISPNRYTQKASQPTIRSNRGKRPAFEFRDSSTPSKRT